MDFSASRDFRLGRSGLLLYLDVINETNRGNAQSAVFGAWILLDGRLVTDDTILPQPEVMPSLGVRWVF